MIAVCLSASDIGVWLTPKNKDLIEESADTLAI
jgi:hypothetical protein